MVDVRLTGEKQILSLRMLTQHPFLDNVSRTKDPVNPEPIDLVQAGESMTSARNYQKRRKAHRCKKARKNAEPSEQRATHLPATIFTQVSRRPARGGGSW